MDIHHKTLLDILRKHPEGLSISEILRSIPDVSRRTVQRALKDLKTSGSIRVIGAGRGLKYCPVDTPTGSETDRFPEEIPLSPKAREILTFINAPCAQRKSVAFDRSFIDRYQPNQTQYLSDTQVRALHRLGDLSGTTLRSGTYDNNLLDRFLVDLSWASSHLEGNTYSLSDTRKLIEHQQPAEGKSRFETQMIINHKNAIAYLIQCHQQAALTQYALHNIHALLAENLLSNPAEEGALRSHPVEIGLSQYQPTAIPALIEEIFAQILEKANAIQEPFEAAFFFMVHIPYLQPYVDLNKRSSRLAANYPLLKHGLCPISFLDVPAAAYSRAIISVYETQSIALFRDLFIWAYQRSTETYSVLKKTLAEPDPIRMQYRAEIRNAVCSVVRSPEDSAENIISSCLEHSDIPSDDVHRVRELIENALRILHEGVLAQYALTLEEFEHWKAHR